MRIQKILTLTVAFVLLFTINTPLVNAEINIYQLDRNHYVEVTPNGTSLFKNVQMLSKTLNETGRNAYENLSVDVNTTMKYVDITATLIWEVPILSKEFQVTFLILTHEIDFENPEPIDSLDIAYINQYGLETVGEFELRIPLGGWHEPVLGKEYYVYLGGSEIEKPFGITFIYEPASLTQIKINDNELEGFVFNKTVYNSFAFDELNADTIITATTEDSEAIVTINNYDTAVLIDVVSRNGAETQQYQLSVCDTSLVDVTDIEGLAVSDVITDIIVVFYDNSKLLKMVVNSNIEIPVNTELLPVFIGEKPPGTKTFKIFFWDSISIMSPLMGAIESQ